MNDEYSAEEPILVSRKAEEDNLGYLTKPSIPVPSAKWIIKIAILVIFVAWAGFIFLFPLKFMSDLFDNWTLATEGTLFGVTGSYFLLFSAPIFIIAFLAIAHLIISGKDELHHNQKRKNSKHPHFSLWTLPVLVDGPFGVVSAAEMIGILLFYVYIIWAVSIDTVRNFQSLSLFDVTSSKERSALMLEMTSVRLALIGLTCLAFLFVPIARGSVLLQFMRIPFEHATKYHVWLGHLTMLLFTLHGLFFVIAWAMQGGLLHEVSPKTIFLRT